MAQRYLQIKIKTEIAAGLLSLLPYLQSVAETLFDPTPAREGSRRRQFLPGIGSPKHSEENQNTATEMHNGTCTLAVLGTDTWKSGVL